MKFHIHPKTKTVMKRKIIYWRNGVENEAGETSACVHILIGYNGATIADYKKMADELRETFPQATDDTINGGKIFKSSFADGHTIIAWQEFIPKSEYPDWTQKDFSEGFGYWW